MFVCIGGTDNVADGILLTIEQQLSIEPSCEHTLLSPSSIGTCGKDIDPTNHTRTERYIYVYREKCQIESLLS